MQFASACNANLFRVVSILAAILVLPGLTPAVGQIVWQDSTDTSDNSIWKYPTRDLSTILGYQFGIDRLDATSSFRIRGERPHTVSYVVDGIPLSNPQLVNVSNVSEAHISTGYISPRYGNNVGSLIEISTKSSESVKTGFSIEEYTESGSLISGNYLAGQLGFAAGDNDARWKFRVQTSAQIVDDLPSEYSAEPFPVLTDEAAEFLRSHPQSVLDGAGAYYPLSRDLGETLSESESCSQLGISPCVLSGVLSTVYSFDESHLTTSRQPSHFTRDAANFSSAVGVGYRDLVWVGIDRQAVASKAIQYDQYYSVFNTFRSPMVEEDDSRWSYSLRLMPLDNVQFNVFGARTSFRAVTHDPLFSSNVEDLILLADPDADENGEALDYYTYSGSRHLISRDRDELVFRSHNMRGSHHALYGSPFAAFTQDDQISRYFNADIELKYRSSMLTVGLMRSSSTQRYFSVDSGQTLELYSFVNQLRPSDTDEWDDINNDGVVDYGELISPFYQHRFFGYNTSGAKTAEETEQSDSWWSPEFSSIQPFESYENALYGEYHFERGDVRLDFGLRLQTNGNNGMGLRDPWTTYPLIRVSDVDSLAGRALDPNLIVHFLSHCEQEGNEFVCQEVVTGFRDSDGNAYDESGNPSTLRSLTGRPEILIPESYDEFVEKALVESHGILSILPRLRVSFDVYDRSVLSFYYSEYARAPTEFQSAIVQDYRQAWAQNVLLNPLLDPEKTTQYGLVYGTEAGLEMEIYRRNMIDRVVQDNVGYHRESGVPLYMNNGTGQVTGASITLSRKLTAYLSSAAFYNIERAVGRQSLSWPVTDPDLLLAQTEGPLESQRLHKAGIDLGLELPAAGENDRVVQWLVDGVSLFAYFRAGSGIRYEPPVYARSGLSRVYYRSYEFSETADAFYKMDISLQKRFSHRKTNIDAFVWLENLFNRVNVNEVYALSGKPNNDSYITWRLQNESGYEPGLDALAYNTRLFNPDHTGIPRVVRVGLRLHF